MEEFKKLLNNFKKSSRALYKTKKERGRLSKYNNNANYNKLMKANRKCNMLQEQYDLDEKSLANFVVHDEENFWNKTKIVIERGKINIFYGRNSPFCKDHGHYSLDLRSGKITYLRPINQPHGQQNFTNYREKILN